MTNAKHWLGGSALIALALGALLWWQPERASRGLVTRTLVIYCAAGLKTPLEQVARDYEQRYGVRLQLQYGGSGTLLSNLRVAGRGDLFLAADESYLTDGQAQGLVREIVPLARMVPVIAVRKGNPCGIDSFNGLLGVKVALANPDAAAIGRIVRDHLRPGGRWDALERRVRVFKPTVTDVANDVLLGTVDAGIVWDALLPQYPGLEAVRLPEFARAEQRVSVGVLAAAAEPRRALHFARYLGAPDKGLKEWARLGYTTVEGDVWSEEPEVVLFSGGVNRLAIEETLQGFEQREGVRITRVYNGCGILVSQMKAGQRPDAYLACDLSFLPEVRELFLEPLNVSDTDVVLLVPGGNPLAIHSVEDLTKPGLRVGIANPEQSALGALTERLLRKLSLWDAVLPNVRVQTPTADLLVNQMRAGALDAAVVYEVNTAAVRDRYTVVAIARPEAKAVQPYAIGANSSHKLLMQRLLAAIRAPASRQRYEALGFHWRAEDP